MKVRLAPGFSVVRGEGAVWLVAGEDVRYRLAVDEPAWLTELLARCDGTRSQPELVATVPPPQRDDADAALRMLVEERVLVPATAAMAHAPAAPAYRVIGDGVLADALRAGEGSNPRIEVLVQDRFDYAALLAHNTAALAARRSWMWITAAPQTRAYVGPLFVPDAGPCAACLLVHFKRLSPAPELYDALVANAPGTALARAELPQVARDVVAALARWKLCLVAEPVAPAALYALHVVDIAALTVASHQPVFDPDCTACRT